MGSGRFAEADDFITPCYIMQSRLLVWETQEVKQPPHDFVKSILTLIRSAYVLVNASG